MGLLTQPYPVNIRKDLQDTNLKGDYFMAIDFGFASLDNGILITSKPLTISAFAFARLNLREIFQPRLKLLFLIPEW